MATLTIPNTFVTSTVISSANMNANFTAVAAVVNAIDNTNISASAAIARSKLASGTANHVVINDGTGVMSSEASLATTRGGTALTSYTTGDIVYASASNTLSKLPIGSTSQFLKVVAGIPAWASLTSLAVVSKTTTYTATSADDIILVDGTSAAWTLSLPAAASNTGKVFYIKRTDSTIANAVTIDPNASETIDGATTRPLYTQNEELTIVSDGTNWRVLNHEAETAWATYTPTGGWTGAVTYAGRWRRSGQYAEIYVTVVLSGAPTGTQFSASFPSGITFDTTDAIGNANASGYVVGSWNARRAGVSNQSGTTVLLSTSTSSFVASATGASDFTAATIPVTWGNLDTFSFYCRFKAANWWA